MKIRSIILLGCCLLQSCTQVDDYMLGKDNTPKPKDLKEITSKIKVDQNWSASVGKSHSSNEYLKLKPIIKGKVIYTADSSGILQATTQKNGQIKWNTHLNTGIVSGPSVNEGFVAVGTNASTLVLLNQETGKELWQAKVSNEILSPPVISKNKVVVKTIDGKVFAFNTQTGKQLWLSEHGAPSLILKASSSPIIIGDLVLVGFSDGKLDALDLETGRVVWQQSIAYSLGSSDVERLVDIDADPIVKDKVAYLATYQGYIGALSLTNGQFIWKKPGSVYKNMLLKANTLYLTDSNDTVWSLDSHTGNVNWKQTALKARGLTEPVLMKDHLVVGDKTGYLHFISIQNGELLGRSHLSAGVSNSPNVQGGKIYVLTDNGLLNQLSVS